MTEPTEINSIPIEEHKALLKEQQKQHKEEVKTLENVIEYWKKRHMKVEQQLKAKIKEIFVYLELSDKKFGYESVDSKFIKNKIKEMEK